MDDIFGTIGGLPLHPLVVHFAIVLLPLGAIGLIVVGLVPRFRRAYLPIVTGALGVGAIFAFLAKQSGEELSESQGFPGEHAALGDVLFPASVGLVALAVTMWLVTRRERPVLHVRAVVAVSVVGAIAVSALTFAVGHSGATATWGTVASDEPRIEGATATPTPSTTPSATPTEDDSEGTSGGSSGGSNSGSGSSGGSTDGGVSTDSGGSTDGGGSTDNGSDGITMADVRTHDSAGDCWVVVGTAVVDLTSFISRHPGGAAVLTALCGTDATSAFQSQHANERLPASELQRLTIGTLSR